MQAINFWARLLLYYFLGTALIFSKINATNDKKIVSYPLIFLSKKIWLNKKDLINLWIEKNTLFYFLKKLSFDKKSLINFWTKKNNFLNFKHKEDCLIYSLLLIFLIENVYFFKLIEHFLKFKKLLKPIEFDDEIEKTYNIYIQKYIRWLDLPEKDTRMRLSHIREIEGRDRIIFDKYLCSKYECPDMTDEFLTLFSNEEKKLTKKLDIILNNIIRMNITSTIKQNLYGEQNNKFISQKDSIRPLFRDTKYLLLEKEFYGIAHYLNTNNPLSAYSKQHISKNFIEKFLYSTVFFKDFDTFFKKFFVNLKKKPNIFNKYTSIEKLIAEEIDCSYIEARPNLETEAEPFSFEDMLKNINNQLFNVLTDHACNFNQLVAKKFLIHIDVVKCPSIKNIQKSFQYFLVQSNECELNFCTNAQAFSYYIEKLWHPQVLEYIFSQLSVETTQDLFQAFEDFSFKETTPNKSQFKIPYESKEKLYANAQTRYSAMNCDYIKKWINFIVNDLKPRMSAKEKDVALQYLDCLYHVVQRRLNDGYVEILSENFNYFHEDDVDNEWIFSTQNTRESTQADCVEEMCKNFLSVESENNVDQDEDEAEPVQINKFKNCLRSPLFLCNEDIYLRDLDAKNLSSTNVLEFFMLLIDSLKKNLSDEVIQNQISTLNTTIDNWGNASINAAISFILLSEKFNYIR